MIEVSKKLQKQESDFRQSVIRANPMATKKVHTHEIIITIMSVYS